MIQRSTVEATCRRGRLRAALVAVDRLLSAAPGFWQAATQADFLRGEVDQLSIDEHGRLTLGPELTRVHDAGRAVRLDHRSPAPTARWFLGTGNDGKVIRVDRNGQGSVFYDSSGDGSARAGAGAERRAVSSAPRPTAASIASMPRARPPRSSIPTTSTSGRWPSIATATCSPAPATRARSTRSRPTARAQKFFATKTSHAVSLAFDQQSPAARRHRRARAACSASTRRARASCCSTPPTRRFTRFASTRRA